MSHSLPNSQLIISLNIISSLFSAYLAIFALRLKNNANAFSFFVLMSIFTFWGIVKLINPFIHSSLTQDIISDLVRGVTTFTPGIILYIVINYTRYPRWFNRSYRTHFFVIPSVLATISFVHGFYHIANSYFGVKHIYGFPISVFDLNQIMSLFLFYLYACILLALFILIRSLFGSSSFFNKQILFIILAILLPAVNDMLFRFDISLIPGYHLTPEMFTLGNIFFAWALFGYRFLKLVPVTRSAVIDSMDDIMLAVNENHLLIDYNKSCKLWFGAAELTGKPFFDVFKDYPELIQFYHDGKNGEIALKHGLETSYFSAKMSVAEYRGSLATAKIILLRDITEKKKSEIQLTQYAVELEKMNATKNKFFSIISHDLKNPFNGLIGFSELLLSEFDLLDSNTIKSYIRTINESAKSGYNLLENLLEWARIQTDTINFNPQKLHLKSIATESIEFKALAARRKNIKIQIEIGNDLFIQADYNMLSTIFRNLVSNAIKFTKPGGHIQIIAKPTAETRNIEVSVADNGIGMDPEIQESLFKIEKKVSTVGTDNEMGTGLGLILCKEFVLKNQGTIWIQSEKGLGTTIFFTLVSIEP